MEQHRILFDSLEWQDGIHGARFKAFRDGTKQLRLLEFTSEFVEPDWCEKGHIGFVVQGELEIDFHGRLVRYPQGSGISIPAGSASGHKARSITPTVLLFLVEDIQQLPSPAGGRGARGAGRKISALTLTLSRQRARKLKRISE